MAETVIGCGWVVNEAAAKMIDIRIRPASNRNVCNRRRRFVSATKPVYYRNSATHRKPRLGPGSVGRFLYRMLTRTNLGPSAHDPPRWDFCWGS